MSDRPRRRLRGRATGPQAKQAVRRRTTRKRSTRGKQTPSVDVMPFRDEGDVAIPCISGPESGGFRGGEYLHVSDLIHKCTRKIALSDTHSAPMPDELIFPSQGLTFAQGHAIGDFIVNRSLQKSPSMVYGKFECLCKSMVIIGTASRVRRAKHICEKCGTSPDKYAEVTLCNDELMLVGNIDLMLMVDDHLHLTELKSIAGHRWEELSRPQPDHKVQILLYWWMARELGMPIHDSVSILYASKAFAIKSPYKEYVLQPSLEMSFIEDHLEEAREWGRYKREGTLPVRTTCGTSSAPQAKKCHVCTQCFA